MRILHVNKFLFGRGGAERYMFDVARALKRRRHDVFFFGTAHGENVERKYERYYPRYRDFSAPRAGAPPRAPILTGWSRFVSWPGGTMPADSASMAPIIWCRAESYSFSPLPP